MTREAVRILALGRKRMTPAAYFDTVCTQITRPIATSPDLDGADRRKILDVEPEAMATFWIGDQEHLIVLDSPPEPDA
jgi:hypothetical protein